MKKAKGCGAAKRSRTQDRDAVKAEGYRDWRFLPELVLDRISDKLEYPSDYLSFLLVCKAWNVLAKEEWPHKKRAKYRVPDRLPMIFRHGRVCHLHCIISGAWVRHFWCFNVLGRCSSKVIGSSFGWLIAYDTHEYGPDRMPPIYVLNLKLRDMEIFAEVPQSRLCNNVEIFDDLVLDKAILSADPSKESDYAVAIMCKSKSTSTSKLCVLYKHGPAGGGGVRTSLCPCDEDQILDISCIAGKICWVDRKCKIRRINQLYPISEHEFEEAEMESMDPFRGRSKKAFRQYSRTYLVERSNGDLDPFLVIHEKAKDEETGKVTTVGFRVFILEPKMHPQQEGDGVGSELVWKKVRSLEDDAMFLSPKAAFCIAPDGVGIQIVGLAVFTCSDPTYKLSSDPHKGTSGACFPFDA
ncbi:hypothetical protein CRG98_019438 [Punica granatum]|uniref:F-box domain-containing protein n=1 Tax=Punica granatum TaxID=22663 RepID=A0A2I0JV24_PUNGR|nr:hypothetical protein CRG98_019438 [Punica granatum]